MKLLDCTLRDGGYYNAWDFSEDVVHAYLHAMERAGVDYVEVGLRNYPQSGFHGPFAYSSEAFLKALRPPESLKLGVMVDAKVLLESCSNDPVCDLFVPAKDSVVSLVRVAAHFGEIERCERFCRTLRDLGYEVGLNMMQSGGKSEESISQAAAVVESWGSVGVLYFADSLGNMTPEEVARIYTALRRGWQGEVGLHAHDNMNNAIANCVKAKELGGTWLDCTVTGMGRGAGNAQTEYLISYLNEEAPTYSAEPIYELVLRWFEPMKKEYGWESNLLYFLAAKNGVHPMFVQSLIASPKYVDGDVLKALNCLSSADGSNSFCGQALDNAVESAREMNFRGGSKDLDGLFEGREVLILCSGPSLVRHRRGIELYIQKNRPVVLALNMNDAVPSSLVDYYLVTHNSKFFSESNAYGAIAKPIILPVHRFSSEELRLFDSETLKIDFGFVVESETVFESHDDHCVSPVDLTIAYALGVATTGASASVKLAGADGYAATDARQIEMLSFLKAIGQGVGNRLSSLTPTTYPIRQESLYAYI